MSPQPLQAITLWPEWAWAFRVLDKRVENRSWDHGLAPGTWLAIHAGASIGGRPARRATTEGLEAVAYMAVDAGWTVEETGHDTYDLTKGERRATLSQDTVPTRCIVGVGQVREDCEGLEMGWAVPGQQHWPLDPFVVLPTPVLVGGAQGLWSVRGQLLEDVRDQWRAARARGLFDRPSGLVPEGRRAR